MTDCDQSLLAPGTSLTSRRTLISTMVIAPYYGLTPRQRTPVSARTLAADLGERFGRMRDNAERLVREPFMGITTDGAIIPNLFPLQATGVLTEPIRTAARDFVDALDADQRRQVQFDIESDAWRRWWNIHPF